MTHAMKRSASPAEDAEEDSADRKSLRKASSWQTFSSTDPLYALMGEVQEKRIVSEAGQVQNELLSRCLQILVVEQAAQKPKDWIEFWAKMNIPVDSQSRVLKEIIAFCLNEPPVGGLGAVLAELIKGHRVKTRAVEEAVETAMAGGQDPRGVLRQMLFSIYPKSPDSDWGWARVGWSWQEWWKIVERTIGSLEKLAAFDELGLLLESLELEGGKPLSSQSIWSEPRLAKAGMQFWHREGWECEMMQCCFRVMKFRVCFPEVRDSLCKFSEVTDTDLQACLAASLTSSTAP